MLDPRVRCVVGIDVAQQGHVVCALDAPTGAVRQKALKVAATAAGYAARCAPLARWGEPPQVLVGMEATGCLWEPLYDVLTAAGYPVVVLHPRQTAAWATGLGLRGVRQGPRPTGWTPRRWRGGGAPATGGRACCPRKPCRRGAS